MALIILKDGKVKKCAYEWENPIGGYNNGIKITDAEEFANYSVKKINSYDCSYYFDNGLYPECKKVKSEFELTDGTNQTIEFDLK